MKYANCFLSFLLVLCNVVAIAPSVRATSDVPVVISHVIAGEASAATSEFVGLYNNGPQDIDLTGYCLKNKSNVQFACISGGVNIRVFIKAHNYLTIASTTYATNHSYQPDTSYTVTNLSSGSIVTSSDMVTLVNANSQPVDSISWTSGLLTGSAWQRNEVSQGSGALMDTDTITDFTAIAHPEVPANASYDVETVIDVCPNLDGTQLEMPSGYMYDAVGDCHQDLCSNITGLQRTIPDTYVVIDNTCTERDVCSNIGGIQANLPSGYIVENGICQLDLLPLQLTELLPNVSGSDTGKEYVEIYNPTDRVANLGLYVLYVGVNNEKSYQFPEGAKIQPGEYVVFYNTQMKFNLGNTTGRVALMGADGTTISQSELYTNPADDEAWAMVDGRWQYTNRPTPSAANLPAMQISEESSGADSPTPCVAGKYRNPLTGRCRNIESDASVLGTCDEGQYRSPETGRCRKLTTVGVLAACKDGQYRSEETNRCRNIATASAGLAPCKDGQERNLETNRCRNVTAAMPAAGFAVESVKQDAKAFIGWWALGAIALLAVGYGVWEWRHEVMGFLRRISLSIKIK